MSAPGSTQRLWPDPPAEEKLLRSMARLVGAPVELLPGEHGGAPALVQTAAGLRGVAVVQHQERVVATLRTAPLPSGEVDEAWALRALEGAVELARCAWLVARAQAELRERQRAFERQQALIDGMVDSIPDLIFYKDHEGVYRGCNQAFGRFVGRGVEQILGRTDHDFFPAEVADFFREMDRAMLSSGEARQNEEWVDYPDGRRVLLDTLKTPYLGPRGEVLGVVGVSRDITRAKAIEEALKAERDLFLLGPVMLFRWGVDDTWPIQYASPNVAPLLGRTAKELVDAKVAWADLVHPADLPRVLEYTHRHVARGVRSFVYDPYRLCLPDGERWVIEVTSVVYDEERQPQAFLGYVVDVSEWQASRHELQRAEERFHMAVDGAALGIWDWSIPTGHVVYNERWAEMLGRSVDDLEQHLSTWEDLVHPDDMPGVQEVLQEHLAGRSPIYTCEYRMRAHDGSWVWILDRGKVLERDADGRPLRASGTHLDITEQKRGEAALQQVAQEKKLEAIGLLAGGLAHDFNNLLTGILGNLELAIDTAGPSVEKEALADALLASQRAQRLTRHLLTFAKGGEPVKTTTTIEGVIHESVSFILRGSGVQFDLLSADDLWLVDIDKGQMGQVLQNLALNARQAMPEGGRFHVTCANVTQPTRERLRLPEHRRFIRVDVTDTGPGIAPVHLDRIFDPYFSTKSDGSGLGLAITHSIVKKHGGFILAASPPTGGAHFTLYLPASEGRPPPEAVALPAEPPAVGRVLVMDDEEMIRSLTERVLTRMGCAVQVAASGAEAIEAYRVAQERGEPFHMVLLDLTIPGGMGGREAARHLLELDPDARIVVSSGYSTNPVVANYRAYGFCAALTKPYSLERLRAALAHCLADAGETPNNL